LWRVGVYQGAAREGMRREAWERTEEGLIFNGADAEQERRHGQGVQNGIATDYVQSMRDEIIMLHTGT